MKGYFVFFGTFFGGILMCDLMGMGWLAVVGVLGFLIFWVIWGWKVALIAGLSIVVAGVRFLMVGVDFADSMNLVFYNGLEVEVEGLVMDADWRADGMRLVVDVVRWKDLGIVEHGARRSEFPLQTLLAGGFGEVRGKVLVKVRRYPEFEYGDLVKISGKLEEPENFEDFDYRRYLAKDAIYSVMSYPSVEKIGEGKVNWFYARLVDSRKWFEGVLQKMLPEPHASFMAGLLIGARKNIPENVLNDFQVTGLTHIIAISGYNITILIIFVSRCLCALRRKWQVLISVVLIIVFTFFVGASAAVTRAAIMGGLGLLALWAERKSNVLLAIGWSGFVMVLWNPLILVSDVGFQLSFLAVLSLVFVMPVLEEYFQKIPNFGGMREAFVTTLAAQVFVLPVILVNFGQMSLISPLANVFVVPWIPLVMMSGFLMVVCYLIFMPFAWLMQAVTWLILKVMLLTTKIFANIPFAAVEISWFAWWMAVLYYLFVIKWLCGKRELFEFI